ncbi:MAG: polyhydroxyalkanoate synthesis repressor PhaR [Pseudomonadota bacterium]
MARHKGDGPIIIKKYANRRLYDTSTSSYVTLEHLSELVRKGADFEVRDAKSGDDLTRSVLTQIIYENETKGEGALPLNFLRQLIGFYGGGAQSMLPAWLDMSMNQFAEAQERWRSALGEASPLSLFDKQAKRNMAMFENTMRMFNPALAPRDTKLDDGDIDDDDEIETPSERTLKLMQAQMAEMQRQLEALSGKGGK